MQFHQLSKNIKKSKILILGFLLLQTTLFSNDIIKEINSNSLYKNSYWKKLLHYKNGESEIDSKDFFVSNIGKYDLKEEMITSINELKNSESNFQCKFPLRTKWLNENLPSFSYVKKECKELDVFIEQIDAKFATLVFPTAHINSPASMYGHTFIRLGSNIETPLISNAVNYAAKTEESNGLVFAYQGIFGGYEGRYSILPYYKKIKEYNNLEQRDVWEYELALNQEEINDIVLHTYELKDTYSDYFFFLENCSYNVLWFLEIAKPEIKLVDKFNVKAIPLDTIKVLEPYDLIKQSNFRTSKMTKMKFIINEKIKNKTYASIYIKALNNDFKEDINKTQQIYFYDLKIEYLKYLRSKNKVKKKDYLKRYLELLKLRSEKGIIEDYKIKPPKNPLETHDSTKLVFSYQSDDSLYLQLKQAYHDLTDIEDGYLQGAYIDFFNIKIRNKNKKTRLESFDFLKIESYSQRDEIFKPLSWAIEINYEHFKDEKDYLKFKPQVGLSYANENSFVYFMGLGEYYKRRNSDLYSLGLRIGVISNEIKNFKLGFEGIKKRYDNKFNNTIYNIFATYKLTRNNAINIKYENDDYFVSKNEKTLLSYYYYF